MHFKPCGDELVVVSYLSTPRQPARPSSCGTPQLLLKIYNALPGKIQIRDFWRPRNAAPLRCCALCIEDDHQSVGITSLAARDSFAVLYNINNNCGSFSIFCSLNDIQLYAKITSLNLFNWNRNVFCSFPSRPLLLCEGRHKIGIIDVIDCSSRAAAWKNNERVIVFSPLHIYDASFIVHS